MRFYYDLHIHSDLSPCGNSDMTPNNIINMAYIKGLNIISLTDHNTVKNIKAVIQVGKTLGIEVIPGIEVTTKEEVHILCYFKEVEQAEFFGDIIYESLPDMKNDIYIFGEQNIYNSLDEITGHLNKLLINASEFSLDKICCLAKEHNGIVVPAHVNKKANSIIEILGFIPSKLDISYIEISKKFHIDKELVKKYSIMTNSDAHQLIDISEAENFVELDKKEDIYKFLKL